MTRVFQSFNSRVHETSTTEAHAVPRTTSVRGLNGATTAIATIKEITPGRPQEKVVLPDAPPKLSSIVEITRKDFQALARRGNASVISDLSRILLDAEKDSGGADPDTHTLFKAMLEENIRRLMLVENALRDNPGKDG